MEVEITSVLQPPACHSDRARANRNTEPERIVFTKIRPKANGTPG